jgi:phosphatidate cytidylyltransferase
MNQYLRSLSATEQISWLFVMLFGALALLTLALVVVSLRERKGTLHDDVYHDELARLRGLLKTSWLVSSVFWTGWVLGAAVATTLFAMIAFFALREFMTLSPTHRSDHKSLVLTFFVVLPLQFWLVAHRHFDLFSVLIPVYVFLALPVVSALANDPRHFLERNAKLQWGIMVCIYGLSHVPALLDLDVSRWRNAGWTLDRNAFLVFFLVIVVQVGMIVQHLANRYWGKAPVAPDISQSFNWASWLAGVVVAALVGTLLAGLTPFRPGHGFAMGGIAAAAGSLGHLVMKAIKRDRGVTHWMGFRTSVTGATGLLDRVDGLCFAAPVFFHSVRWYFS